MTPPSDFHLLLSNEHHHLHHLTALVTKCLLRSGTCKVGRLLRSVNIPIISYYKVHGRVEEIPDGRERNGWYR